MPGSRAYWAARAVQREQEAFLRGRALSLRLLEQYGRASRELRRKANDFYLRYARENRLTYEDAVKALNRAEAREWKATLGEWVERINSEADLELKAQLKAQLDALSYRSRMDRLDALCGEIQIEMDALMARSIREMGEEFGEVYAESYYKKSYDLQARAGRLSPVAGLTREMIEDATSYPWSGADFSSRVWENGRALVFHLREELTQGLIQGKGAAEISQALADRMGQSYNAAERLVRTETNHLHGRADLAAYETAGVEEYEFMATLDARTCSICGALDGEHFLLKDARPGENYPPVHPNDRCTTVEYDPEDAADWAASGVAMPEETTYEQWRNRMGLAPSQKSDILSMEEDQAVQDYIGPASYRINDKLRRGATLSEDERGFVRHLDGALEKLPVYQGAVYRSMTDFDVKDLDAFWAGYTPGRKIRFSAYTSSGTEVYDESFPIQYVLQSRTGRDLRGRNPGEAEILFPRDTEFRVLRVEGHTIFMEEI